MKQLTCLLILSLFLTTQLRAQNSYRQQTEQYLQDYVLHHEVVKGEHKKRFAFYPVNEQYVVKADFIKVDDAEWFSVNTSKGETKKYRTYGILNFTINDTLCTLHIYQSQALLAKPEYTDYLFLPFMDATTAQATYGSGRYMDFKISQIIDNRLEIDFNKAYNPYCAYGLGTYNCPITPEENRLPVTILAGEKNFRK